MELRKRLLKIMLWCLGLSALAGVLAVLFTDRSIIWRVTGTGLTAAGAAGLLIIMSLMIDRPRARMAGLLGMFVVIIEFISALALMWAGQFLGPAEEELGISMFFLAATAIPAGIFLAIARTTAGAVAGRIGAFLSAVVFVLLLVAIWLPGQARWDMDHRLSETAGALSALGALGTFCLVGVGTSDRRYWRWLGVLGAIVTFGMTVVHTWYFAGSGHLVFELLVCVTAAVAYANLLVRVPLPEGQTWVRTATIAAGLATALGLAAADLLENLASDSYGIQRLAGAAGIVASCGVLSLLVLARLNKRIEFEVKPAELVSVTLFCPRCKRKHTLPIGNASCPTCHLRIQMRVEDPLCRKCNYPLTGLTGDRCPECGTPIADTPVSAPSPTSVPPEN